MATSIHNVLSVTVEGISSATSAANRTFTTTRALRVFDTKAFKDDVAVAGAAAALIVSNAGSAIATMTTPNPPQKDMVYRLGQQIAASTCDDAQMLVASGGTIVFGVSTADTFNLTAFCIPA